MTIDDDVVLVSCWASSEGSGGTFAQAIAGYRVVYGRSDEK